jgi:uncharacterized RDD family membrane protein YckC
LNNVSKKNVSFDSSLEALTPEGVAFLLSPAGFPARTLAYVIDKITQWLIILAGYLILISFRKILGMWLMLILNFCVDWFYHVICELAFHGQSPGKRAAGIRVVNSDGSPVDPASSFLRNLLRFADTFFFLFPVAFVTMLASPGFRRIGDWAAGTLVVYTQIVTLANKTKHSAAASSFKNLLLKYEPINVPQTLSQAEKQLILNFARRYPLLGEARANEIAAYYAPSIREEQTDVTDAEYLLGIAAKLAGKGDAQ